MSKQKQNCKPSAQLLIGSYDWALARLHEDPRDKYALMIKIKFTAATVPLPTLPPPAMIIPGGRRLSGGGIKI